MKALPSFFLFLFIFIFTQSLTAATSTLFFPDLWQARVNASDSNQLTDKEILTKEAIESYLAGADATKSKDERRILLEKSIENLQKIWKIERTDNKNILRLSYAMMTICDTNIPLDKIIENVFKAKALFDTVIDRLPENLEARMGRLMVNMNMPPAQRPDEILARDAEVFIKGYESLSKADQNMVLLKMGYASSLLSQVIVLDAKGEFEKARSVFQKITESDIAAFNQLYVSYEKKFKK